ncbi:APC family permease [Natrinema soli]|uniref:APC family permease n=1 Tax=Natrinema soli TaxID=1930624 RepID=A0ABD5SSU8_9EURY|nr:APC family permease [Natrinema soli]
MATEESELDDSEFSHTVSWWGPAVIAVGLVVSTSTFAGGYILVGQAGPAFAIALLLGFAVNLLAALAFTELTTMFPKAGQIYEYTKQAFSESNRKNSLTLAAGIGTGYWLLFGLVWAAESTAGASAMVQSLNVGSIVIWILILNLLAIGVNMLGIGTTLIIEVILIVVNLGIRVIFGLLALFGFTNQGASNPAVLTEQFMPFGWTGVLIASTLGVWAFIGLEFATPLVEEVKNPEKNIPSGVFLGAVVILVVGLVMGLGVASVLDPATRQAVFLGNAPQIQIGNLLLGDLGVGMAVLASFASTMGALVAAYAAIPRIIYAMAREGLWPKQFAWLHPRFESPWPAIGLTGGIVLIPTFFSQTVTLLISAATAAWLLAYLWVFGLAIKLKWSHADVDRPFSMPTAAYVIGIAATVLVLGSYAASYGIVNGSALLGLALLIFVVGYAFARFWISRQTPETITQASAGMADD